VATPTNDDDLPKAADEMRKLIDRSQRGDETTLPVLRKLLEHERYVDAFGGNLALQTERTLIEAAAGKDLAFKEALNRKLHNLRAELSGPAPTPVERLLVERIMTPWLQLQDADVRFAQAKDLSIAQADYHQRRINHAHKRFLSAVKTLTTVRRLAVPVIIGHVNVAGKQVNKVELSGAKAVASAAATGNPVP
jgi:hypothetical protein